MSSRVTQNEVDLFCDNRSVVHLSNYPNFYERTNHIDIKLHFIHDVIVKVFIVEKYTWTRIGQI